MSAETEALATDLYAVIEADQGFSYISDGVGNMTRTEILDIARKSLASHERCVRLLRGWLARADVKHGDCQMPHDGRRYAAWLCVTDGAAFHLHVCGTHARRYTGHDRYNVQPIEKGKRWGSRASTGCRMAAEGKSLAEITEAVR